MDTNRFEELRKILYDELFVGVPAGQDMGDKIALIAMICYLTNALKKKKPSVTYFDVINLCMKDFPLPFVDEDQLQILALVCEWFAADCKIFPNLGVSPAEMPEKIKNLISNLLPF